MPRRSWIALLLILAPAPTMAASPTLFRPLSAAPRENQLRLQFVSSTQDFRYGTDVTDSTSTGGVEGGRQGVDFEIGAGKTFMVAEGERMLSRRGPWRRWQLGVPAGIFAGFQRFDGQLVHSADYQFGLELDAWWGRGEGETSPVTFDAPVVTSRLQLYHRSSHVGDEYVTLGRFGRNQEGLDTSEAFRHPPVKRADVSYEALDAIVSVEWAPGAGRSATLRLYGGGDLKVPISNRRPRGMKSPSAQLGVEFRSGGNRADLSAPAWLAAIPRRLGHPIAAGFFGALDLRLSRPFLFATSDDPAGEREVWIPGLHTNAPYGSETRRYLGSWHGMIGMSLFRADQRDESRGGRRTAPEVLITLDWHRGLSPHGPFQDMRTRYHPRWYVVPAITLTRW